MINYATSNIHDTVFGIKNIMRGGSSMNITQIIYNKKEFLVKIFATLLTQLGITYYIMTNYQRKDDKNKWIPSPWILMFLSLFIIIILAIIPMSTMMKLIIFTIFSSITGLLFSYLMAIVNPNIVKAAVIGTMGIFASFFLIGLLLLASGIVLGLRTGLVLLFALLILIISMVLNIYMGGQNEFSKYLTGIGLALFSLFIVYDTNRILQKEYYGDFVTASLEYYLDIINIFIRLLNFNRH